MKIFSPILKGTTTVAQGTTNLSGSFTGSLLGTAATASYADNFTVGGTLTAQTINVQIITSSIEFNTGSTRNGSSTANTHQFTGSVLMTGSLSVTGSAAFSSDVTTGGKILISDGGNATIPCLKIGSATTGISQNVSEQLNFITNSTTKMIISSSGNVGIGTTSPNYTLHIDSNTTLTRFQITNSTTGQGAAVGLQIIQNGLDTLITNRSNGYLGFETNSTERIRILANGNIGIRTTTPVGKLHIVTTGNSFTPTETGIMGGNNNYRLHIQSTEPGIMLSSDANGSGSSTGTQTYQLGFQIGVITTNDIRSHIYFGNSPLSFLYSGDQGSNGSERMRISTNGSIGAPNGTNIYNASDARLKQNVSTTTYGLNTISLLNPVKFNWVDGFEPTEDGKDMLGFVAQEVQTVIPEAIESFGGNSITIGNTVIDNPLRVNEKFIIPVLVKAIQELSSKNTSLEERLTALENN